MGRGFRLTPNYILFGGCEVTYYVDTNEVYEETVEEGADATQPESFTPTKTGWTFVGWTTSDTDIYNPLDSLIIEEQEEITLYAIYKNGDNYYNGGSGSVPLTSWTFTYTGGVQTFTVPNDGLYQIEAYGSIGGTSSNALSPGNGGYSKGYKLLTENEVLYAVCGGVPYNGGGSPASKNGWPAGYGGGATHVGKTNTLLRNTTVANLLIVAGGGGGSGYGTASTWAGYTAPGGSGGGTTGGSAIYWSTRGNRNTGATGGTQSAGGSGNYPAPSGTYGQGGNGAIRDSANEGSGAGGGGGYYGGGGGAAGQEEGSSTGGGGGGSGYIGGVPAVTYKGTTYSPSTTNGTWNSTGKVVITRIA